MKRSVTIGTMALALIFVMCGGDKGAPPPEKSRDFDARIFLADRLHATEDFALALEKAGDAGDAAAAMVAFTGEMKKLAERKKSAPEEFRSLDLRHPEKAPAELRDMLQKNGIARAKAMQAYKSVLLRYRLSPMVKKAQEEMNSVKDE